MDERLGLGEVAEGDDFTGGGSSVAAVAGGGLEGWVRGLERILVDVGLERVGERERERE